MLHVVGQLPPDLVDLANGHCVTDRLENAQHCRVRSLRLQAKRACELTPDRVRGHGPIRPVKTLIKPQLQFRGKLCNQMLSLSGYQTSAEHANTEQQSPLRAIAVQPTGILRDHANQPIVSRLGTGLSPHQGAGAAGGALF
jgi:hypothetical protein